MDHPTGFNENGLREKGLREQNGLRENGLRENGLRLQPHLEVVAPVQERLHEARRNAVVDGVYAAAVCKCAFVCVFVFVFFVFAPPQRREVRRGDVHGPRRSDASMWRETAFLLADTYAMQPSH
jgi:hypothetical protein